MGILSKEEYIRKVQPAYAQVVELINHTPEDAKIYMLFEPRSYYIDRVVQTDLILDNFAHDYYLYGDPEKIWRAWQSEGYTHVVLFRQGLDFLTKTEPKRYPQEMMAALNALTLEYLEPVSKTEYGSYELYEIKDDRQPGLLHLGRRSTRITPFLL